VLPIESRIRPEKIHVLVRYIFGPRNAGTASRKLPTSCLKSAQGPRSARGSMTRLCTRHAGKCNCGGRAWTKAGQGVDKPGQIPINTHLYPINIQFLGGTRARRSLFRFTGVEYFDSS